MSIATRRTVHRIALLAAAWAPAAVWADLPKQFTLGKHVPSECWLYVHAVGNQEREWIDQKWGEVFKAAGAAGIDRDIAQLVLSLLDGEQKTQAEALIDKFMKHVKAVRWADMAQHEFVFAQRLAASKRGNEYLLLGRGTADGAEPNFTALKNLLKEISSLSDKLAFVESESGGVQCAAIDIKDPEIMEFGLGIQVFRNKEIVGLASGKDLADKVTASLGGSSSLTPLVSTDRFKKALAMVPEPEDEVVFFDMDLFVGDLRQMFAGFTRQLDAEIAKDPGNEDAAEGRAVLAVVAEVFSMLDVADFSIATGITQDRQSKFTEITLLQPGGKDSPCAKFFLNRHKFEQFDKYIPSDAKSFELTGFVDLEGTYNYALDFVKKNIPNGPAYVDMFHAKLATVGIDLQRDFFSWWSGEMITFEMPPAVARPMGGADTVLMIRVKDPKIAAQKVFGGLDFISAQAQEHGQMFTVPPSTITGGEFRQLSHPAAMMFFAPVVGFHENWLMFGSSADAVKKSLSVATGDSPSIMKNEQFLKEGLVPKGPFLSASFTDKSAFGQEMGAFLGAMGMAGQMVVANIPEEDPGAAKAKQLVRSALGIAMKLGPILQKIDFLSSESSLTTYDGDVTLRKDTIITYKPQTAVTKAGHGK